MRELPLEGAHGVRIVPSDHQGAGALVLAGSSGRVDAARARLLSAQGILAESIQWFGGVGQHDGPWEIPLETFLDRVCALAAECDRVFLVGTSFGAEAALVCGAMSELVDGVVAFAPSDVVWAGVDGAGRVTSHWSHDGVPLRFVPYADDWAPAEDPPAFVEYYRASRDRVAAAATAATIPVERVRDLVLVAGGDDKVWPALEHAHSICERRRAHGLGTTLVADPEAGHRAILPGEQVVAGGLRMQRGGTELADRRLGAAAWTEIVRVLS